MVVGIAGIIAELLIESVPLGLFFLSIILIGNILRYIFSGDTLDAICHEPIKLDLFSLTSGLLVTLIPIFYRKSGILDIVALREQETWIGILIVSFIAGFIIWNCRIYGMKWIKDQAKIVIGIFFVGFLFYVGYNAIIEGFNILAYKECAGNTVCLIKFAIDKLFKIGLAIVFIIWGIKLFKFINKTRRYRNRKRKP